MELKAELKAWERSFQQEHGRKPGKADIKADPAIGKSAVLVRIYVAC